MLTIIYATGNPILNLVSKFNFFMHVPFFIENLHIIIKMKQVQAYKIQHM